MKGGGLEFHIPIPMAQLKLHSNTNFNLLSNDFYCEGMIQLTMDAFIMVKLSSIFTQQRLISYVCAAAFDEFEYQWTLVRTYDFY